MSQAAQFASPESGPQGSLRAEMEARRSAGQRFSVKEAIAIVVPLCVRLSELHAQGKTFFVHPSDLRYSRGGGLDFNEALAHGAPSNPRDRACLAPEERKGAEGDARASVFTIGAMLYELLTGQAVGPGMRRPAELVPDLPPQLEVILGKALVADPKHRPNDLGALAQALYNIAPGGSIAPPSADEGALDHGEDFEVDIRLSMIPPNEAPGYNPADPRSRSAEAVEIPRSPPVPNVDGPYPPVVMAAQAPVSRRKMDPTQRLADMKAALESDPRPRYTVIKDGMDHGPFNAVELLQQIASGSFLGEHVLKDVFTNDERFIKDWEEFAPFAEQAKLNRDIKVEKQALETTVAQEKQSSQYKTLVGAALIGIIAAGGAGWWYRERTIHQHELEVQNDQAVAVDVDGGLGPNGKAGGHVPGGGGASRPLSGGNYPSIAGGGSCESAIAHYNEEWKIGGNNGAPDLTAGAYGNVLNKGSYLNSCGVPNNMEVDVCVAVQNGHAVGVTVNTNPRNGGISSCIAGQVRGLPFPSSPRMDVARTHFAAQ